MPSPKNLVLPRPFGLKSQMCRAPRRKLALSRKTSYRVVELPSSNFETDQVATGQRYVGSSPIRAARFVEQADGRETFLQAIVEACAASVAVLDESGTMLYVSKPWRFLMEEDCQGGGSLDLNYLERWEGNSRSDKRSALAQDIQDILTGNVTEFHNEYWCPTLTGSRFFVIHATRLDLPGSIGAFRVLVNSEDTTTTRQAEAALRDLGGRLITAQEVERSRVARELHDDLNQRMALLSIELEQLAQRTPADQANVRQSIHNVCARAQEISSEIQRVSYQLHPSKLDHLGLLAAVRSFCNELGDHHQVKITFRETGSHGVLPKEVTLCLFRIVQESLRNVIKHSGAREATVTLDGSEHAMQLTVSDTGHGFDAGSSEAKAGLGLISIRERLRLVGGEISIHSTVFGTRIYVSVPLGTRTGSEDVMMEPISEVTTRIQ
jgi:signal transduction histidine kinase